MNTQTNPTSYDGRRKHKFIDSTIQGRLLFALIGLELVLFSLAMFWLHHELSTLVEQNLYRVHYSSNNDTSALLNMVFMTIALVLIINVVALWIADFIWRRYVNQVIFALDHILSAMAKMNFFESATHKQINHEVLTKARLWQAQERQHYNEIKQAITILPDKINPADKNAKAQAEQALKKLQSLIKKQYGD